MLTTSGRQGKGRCGNCGNLVRSANVCPAMTVADSVPTPGKAGLPPRPRRARSAAQGSRSLVAALLAALVLLGGLEIHPAAEAHEPVAALAGHHQDVYFPGASHPVQPPHAETATPAERPLCAACLNRVQSMGVRLDRAARLGTPLPGRSLPAAVATSPLRRSPPPDPPPPPPPRRTPPALQTPPIPAAPAAAAAGAPARPSPPCAPHPA